MLRRTFAEMTAASAMPEKPRTVYPYSIAGQCIVALLHALEQLGSSHSKQDSLAYLRSHHYFAFEPVDFKSYPSDEGTSESRWSRLVAFARDVCVKRGWMFHDDQPDCWQITRDGRNVLARTLSKYRSGALDASRCYFWSPEFKRLVSPTYNAEAKQTKRPSDLYRDHAGAIDLDGFLDDII